MGKPLLFPVIVIFLLVVIVALLGAAKSRRMQGNYVARKLLTENEREFFGRLVCAMPDHYIFPQVAMSALLESSSRDKRQAYSDHLRIAQHRVDYVICNSQCDVIAVVELDDRTHSRSKDELRDQRLSQAGVRTVRFHSRNKPTAEVIRASILPNISAAATDRAGEPERRTKI